MSITVKLHTHDSGFYNFNVREDTEISDFFLQSKLDALSGNSRMGVDIEFKELAIKFVVFGSFSNVVPGITLSEAVSRNINNPITREELSINGELYDTFDYNAPITFASFDFHPSILYAGDDVVYAPIFADRTEGIEFFGFSGNDKFYAHGSHEYNDIFFGGAGIDSLIYSGARTNYTVSASNNVWNPLTQKAESTGFYIMDNTGRDGVVQISEVERIIFSDQALGLDIMGNAGQAYRIYKAAFDRAPDDKGLGYWINDLDQGASIKDVAGGFMASAEFEGLYGANPSDQAFISLLYNNVLGRELDQPGFEYWMQDIARGETRASLLVNFSESQENQDNVAELIGNGVVYLPWGE